MNAALMDVREGGRWTRAQRVKNDAIYALVSCALVAGRLPAPVLRALGRMLGRTVHALVPSLRRLAELQIARIHPDIPPALLARRTFVEMGSLLGEALHQAATGAVTPLPVDPETKRLLERAHAEGRGVVLASAHLGPFERVAAALATHVPFTVVARESYDPRLQHKVYARLRRHYRAIYRGAPGAGLAMVRALRRGFVVGIPMDLRTRAESIPAPFLGDPAAPTAVGPARLALRTGALVVVATAAPTSTATPVVTATAIDCSDLDAGPQGERTLTERINAELGRRIAAMPTAWPWMHRRC